MAFQIKRAYEPASPADGARDPEVNHAVVLKSYLSKARRGR